MIIVGFLVVVVIDAIVGGASVGVMLDLERVGGLDLTVIIISLMKNNLNIHIFIYSSLTTSTISTASYSYIETVINIIILVCVDFVFNY